MNPEEIIEGFKNHQHALAKAQGTIDWQEVLLYRFFAWLQQEGITRITDVDRNTMLCYQLHISQLKNRKGIAYDTRVQNRHITVVRGLFHYLRMRNEVFVDPTAGMEMARTPKKLPKDILSVEEVILLLKQPDVGTHYGIRDKAMLEVLYSTAIRRNELLNLDLEDLRQDDGTIFIREGKYSRDRVVPCGRLAWKWLKKYLAEVRPLYVLDSDEQAVFLNFRFRQRLGKQGLKGVLDYCSKSAGIQKKATPHALRHSCATHMSDNGADIAHLQKLLGHARADTTALYLHVAIGRLKKVHSKFHPREQVRQQVSARSA